MRKKVPSFPRPIPCEAVSLPEADVGKEDVGKATGGRKACGSGGATARSRSAAAAAPASEERGARGMMVVVE